MPNSASTDTTTVKAPGLEELTMLTVRDFGESQQCTQRIDRVDGRLVLPVSPALTPG